jgi:hypothetical protein
MNSTNEVAQASPVPSQHLAITEAYQARKKADQCKFQNSKSQQRYLIPYPYRWIKEWGDDVPYII